MPGEETRSRTPLLDVSEVRFEDGSSLSMVGNLRRVTKLQGFPPIPNIHNIILLLVLRRLGNVGLEGDIERRTIYGEPNASQLRYAGCYFRDNRTRVGRFYWVAYSACIERPDHDRMFGKN